MDFELSDDQVALQDAARELLDGYASPAHVRAVVDGGGGLDPSMWAAMVEQGWPAIAVPESFGGLGLGTVELAVLLEQVGAHVASAPILSQAVALDALVRAVGGGARRASEYVDLGHWITRLLAGEGIAAVAWKPVVAEPVTSPDQGPAGGWLLTGTPEPVVYGPGADLVVVVGRAADGEPHLFAVPIGDGDDHGGAARPVREPAMDLTREQGWLHLDRAPAVELGGRDAAAAHLDLGATLYAAELLGAAARAMDLAVGYAKERQQFGKPIGSFQAVKHRCADMLVDVEGMRSVVYYAAWCLAAGDPDASIAASTAKTWCADASKRVLASSLQVHGGIGFTWECDVHLFLKRAQVDQLGFGDATFHRTRLAGLLRQRVEAGESVI